MNKIKSFLFRLIGNVCFGIKTSFLASKFYFLMKLIILLSTTVAPLVSIWLWKEILNGIVDYETKRQSIFLCLLLYLGLQLVVYLLNQFDIYVNERYNDELTFYIATVMMEKTSRMDLAYFDSAQMGDKISHAGRNFSIMSQTTWLVFDIISALINVIITLLAVCTYKWWLGIITLLLLIPFMIYNKKRADRKLIIEKEQLRDNRKKDYYHGIFFDNNVQFEIKLNYIGDYFLKKYCNVWRKLYKINLTENVKHNLINMMFMIINVSSELLILTVSVFDILNQHIHIGDLQYNISMLSRLRNQTQGLIDNINRFINNNTRLIELQEFIKIKPEKEKSGTLKPSNNPK